MHATNGDVSAHCNRPRDLDVGLGVPRAKGHRVTCAWKHKNLNIRRMLKEHRATRTQKYKPEYEKNAVLQ